MYQSAFGAGGIEIELQAVKLIEMGGMGQLPLVACARVAVHRIKLHKVHHVETVVHVPRGDSVERVRAAGNAVEARLRKERGKVTGEPIQLVPTIIGEGVIRPW